MHIYNRATQPPKRMRLELDKWRNWNTWKGELTSHVIDDQGINIADDVYAIGYKGCSIEEVTKAMIEGFAKEYNIPIESVIMEYPPTFKH